MIYMSSGSINTPEFSLYARKPIFRSYYRHEKYILQKNMISYVLIGGFVEIDRAFHRNDLKVNEWFQSKKSVWRPTFKLRVILEVAVQNQQKTSARAKNTQKKHFLGDTLYMTL